MKVECIVVDVDMIMERRIIMPNMITPRGSFKAVAVGQHIYVFGGRDELGLTAACERYVVAVIKLNSFFNLLLSYSLTALTPNVIHGKLCRECLTHYGS